MGKRRTLVFFYLFTALVILFNLLFFIKDEFFYSIESLPQGKFIYSSLAPTGEKSALLYLIDSPRGQAVRVELVEFDSDMSVKEQRNIYWAVGYNNATVGWEDNDIINIDGIYIDTNSHQYYDCRDY